MKNNGIKTSLRKIRKLGSSYYCCLPFQFVAKNKLVGGDKVMVISTDESELIKILNIKKEVQKT